MLSATVTIALIALALLTIVVAAGRVGGVAQVLLVAQAVYWTMSYVARPLVLLVVRPEPSFGDNVADPRLARIGYDVGLALVLRPVVYGMWVYAGLVVVFALWARRRSRPARTVVITRDPNFLPTLCVLYLLGTTARLASVATGVTGKAGEVESASPVLSLLTMLATVGALGLIAFARFANPRHTLLVVGVLMLGELWWTTAIQSKTPVLGAALAIAVRFGLEGWTRTKVVSIAAVSLAGIGAFGWLQSLKATDYSKAEAALTDSGYPPVVQPFLSLLRRFDLLEAATDVYYTGPNAWLSADQVVNHLLVSMVPTQLLGAEKAQSGTEWANHVRGTSVDMSQVSVSLAEGNVNEGYVLGGYLGVTLGMLCTFALLLVWERTLYSRMLIPVIFGTALIEFPVIFERGVLGTAETLGKFLQAAVLIWLVYLAVGELRRKPGPSGAPAPVRPIEPAAADKRRN